VRELIYGGISNPELNVVLGNFASERIWPDGRTIGEPYGTMGVVEDGRVIAAVVFHNWDDRHGVIEITAAADTKRWLDRRTLRRIFEVCFDQHGCQLVVARMEPRAGPLRRIFKAYGFTEMVLPRFGGRDEDEILCMLTDDDWRTGKWFKR
jgi:RimJ/RimL family protein N-acetyltransferase